MIGSILSSAAGISAGCECLFRCLGPERNRSVAVTAPQGPTTEKKNIQRYYLSTHPHTPMGICASREGCLCERMLTSQLQVNYAMDRLIYEEYWCGRQLLV
eukprot:Gregarina_sp_Pseudo_9__1550@NODE_203_length_3625_cov_14_639989_g188_i0_p7_GENE_NODE_203_length_3625_cov_14_639989_g188_i0NODE_203_length_3625_cov_14_639989_g188_i0_p7_ORF_typecomplete_len101_score1_53Ubox/PF04564_15/0_025DUF740/PF05340_12/0_19_NODE_203_length_3625_cov_14_639989_g188_i0544846